MEDSTYSLLERMLANREVLCWGIDLGTTNSVVTEAWSSSSDTGLPKQTLLELRQPTTDGVLQSPMVPSVVAVLPDGQVWVGEGARRLVGPRSTRHRFAEAKNEMGVRKTYLNAPEDLDRAWKVSGRLLEFLATEGAHVGRGKPCRTVVTVPASFQLNQRRDTLLAAQAGGLELKPFDLLDEPVAALIDFMFSEGGQAIIPDEGSQTTLVFDFGGGTCDVFVADLSQGETGRLRTVARSCSRYHRLGGGDLDAAIVHQVLIPQLCLENGLGPRDLTWSQRKKLLEPALRFTAESLKTGLCMEIDRLRKLGRYSEEMQARTRSRQPGVRVMVGKKEFCLSEPTLTVKQWEEVLAPYLDSDLLFPRSSEYYASLSIFAPISDALDRAHLEANEIEAVLLVGGSSLIPQVRDAVSDYFQNARIFEFPGPEEAQLAVSRGAALHAWHLETRGRPLITPIAGDAICLAVAGGDLVDLVPAGSAVPFPGEGWMRFQGLLLVPEDGPTQLRLEIRARSSSQILLSQIWKLGQVARKGDRILLDYRLGENQELECVASLQSHPEERLTCTVENPLVAVVNPNRTRDQIEELEEQVRGKGGFGSCAPGAAVEIAELYAELAHYDRASELLLTALRVANRQDPGILNLLGLYAGRTGDSEQEEKYLRLADEASPRWNGPLFNLSLACNRRNEPKESLAVIEEALRKEPDCAASHVHRAHCLRRLGREDEAQEEFQAASGLFRPLATSSDWELGWHETCARELQQSRVVEQIREERSRRNLRPGVDAVGLLPRTSLED